MDDLQEGRQHKNGRSLFGPVLLIAAGVYFLLRNLGIVAELNWAVALQLWPLLLIFLGINIIVQQVRRPFGTFLSGIVSLTAVAIFGAILLFGKELPLLSRFNLLPSAEYRQETVAVSAEGVESAEIYLDSGSLGMDVAASSGGGDLLEGTIYVVNDYDLKSDVEDGKADVSLGEKSGQRWFGNWGVSGGAEPWQIGLSQVVPTDLSIDSGSGRIDLQLGGLLLTDLRVDTGSGAVSMQLPGGDYDIYLDSGSGHVVATLPANGRHEITIDTGSGAVDLFLPTSMAARVSVDSGSGRVSLDGRFIRISGEGDDGVWETPNYDPDDPDSLELIIDSGSGSVTIEQPQGR